ncbi:hypothetical protein ACTXT7_011280 [Hymenolepis weldensis]
MDPNWCHTHLQCRESWVRRPPVHAQKVTGYWHTREFKSQLFEYKDCLGVSIEVPAQMDAKCVKKVMQNYVVLRFDVELLKKLLVELNEISVLHVFLHENLTKD